MRVGEVNLNKIEVGNRIRTRRKELRYTLKDVADLVNVAPSTIQRYEAGTIEHMKIPVLYSISRALNVNYDWLIGESDSQDIPTSESFLRTSGGWAFTSYFLQKTGISTPEYKLILAYRAASPADRQIIDNIVERYKTQTDEQTAKRLEK